LLMNAAAMVQFNLV